MRVLVFSRVKGSHSSYKDDPGPVVMIYLNKCESLAGGTLARGDTTWVSVVTLTLIIAKRTRNG